MTPIKRIWGITIERDPTDTAKLVGEIDRLKSALAARDKFCVVCGEMTETNWHGRDCFRSCGNEECVIHGVKLYAGSDNA